MRHWHHAKRNKGVRHLAMQVPGMAHMGQPADGRPPGPQRKSAWSHSVTPGQESDGSWSEAISAPIGTHIVEWKIGTKELGMSYGSESCLLTTVVSLQGKCSNDEWLPELHAEILPAHHSYVSNVEGFSALSGRGGGWLTSFLGKGDQTERDDPWELDAPVELARPCKVIGYQLRSCAWVGSARFQYESVPVKVKFQLPGISTILPLTARGQYWGEAGVRNAKNQYQPRIALLVVTPTELRVLLSQLRPPSSAERIIEIRPRHHTYWLGRLGEHNVIVARATDMASAGMQKLVEDLKQWSPKWVINVGIGWGAGPNVGDSGQKLGDVMVPDRILPYGSNDKRQNGQAIMRADTGQPGQILRACMQAAEVFWTSPLRPDPAWYPVGGITGKCPDSYVPVMGTMISVGDLLRDAERTQEHLTRAQEQDHQTVIGGDMEGFGLAYACRYNGFEWIMVKGICDWGNDSKHDGYQELAMYNAVELVKYVLEDPGAAE